MCGIVGFINFHQQSDSENILRLMTDKIRHRGPDSSGVWCEKKLGVFLGHRRLSILDLSPTGAQPFQSNSGRYIISFNGEIYNFKELKKILNVRLKGSSDTEVLLESIEELGIDKTLEMINGMFAFALWDNKLKTLILCRDRIGEKPLYYGYINKTFYFSSELKALKKHPKFKNELNFSALSKYFKYGYIPAPLSIYNNIKKLCPGTYLEIKYEDILKSNRIDSKPIPYWSYQSKFRENKDLFKNLSDEEIYKNFDSTLSNVIKKQMISDVPLGCFLSGGIDSSLIAAVMQKVSSNQVNSFTIGFNNPKFNEAENAKKIANYLGTNHTELYVTEKDAIDVVPQIPSIYCEPFADSSQIPTFLVSKLASKNVTVSLSGDGGDELFYGYSRYRIASDISKKLELVPFSIRKIVEKLIEVVPEPMLNITLFWVKHVIRGINFEKKNIGSFIKKSQALLRCASSQEIYIHLISKWTEQDKLILNKFDFSPSFVESHSLDINNMGLQNYMMTFDILSYLPDDILVKVDRAAMSNSLETRVPLLDRDIVEFTQSVPLHLKDTNVPKNFLKKTLENYIPKNLTERPKMGFGVPLSEWLRKDLNDWCIDLLNEDTLKDQGIINHTSIQNKLNQHMNGEQDWHAELWQAVIFQQWIQNE